MNNNDIDDSKLDELSFAQQIRDICLRYLKKTGKEVIFLKVLPIGGTSITFDKNGKTCFGLKHDVVVHTWTEEEFQKMMSTPPVPETFIDDDEDD